MTRKNAIQKTSSSNQGQKDELSVKQVYDVLEMAKAAVNIYPGVMTPQLLNQRMQDLSFNPLLPTQEKLDRAFSSPKESEEQLRSFVEYLEMVSAPFSRIMEYMASMLSFSLSYVNIDVDQKYDSNYKKDLSKLWNYLDRFDYERSFRIMTKQLLRNEIFVCTPRDDGDKIILQELPLSRIKITGKWDYGYLCDFDFMYFVSQPGVDINMFHPWFAKKFVQLFGENGLNGSQLYNPNVPVEMRGNTNYVYYVPLPPEIGFVFKLDESLTTAIPKYASLMYDLVNQPMIRNLQKNIYLSEALKLIMGEVPMLDSKAKVADMFALNPTTLGQFLGLVKSAIGEAVKVSAVPLTQTKAMEFSPNNDLYNSYLKTAVSASGVNSPLIYSGDLKANAIESQLSFQSDSLTMEQSIYSQCSGFMNYFISKIFKKTKFQISFSGNAYYLDRGRILDNANALADKGIVLPQMFAAGLGMKPQNLLRQMAEAKAMGFVDDLTPIINSAQMSGGGGSNVGGRPSKKDSELTDSGEQSRSDASNVAKGGKK